MSAKQTIFISLVQKELAHERRAGTKSALSQGLSRGQSRDQAKILAKSSTGAALVDFLVIAATRLGLSFGTKSRHQVIQPPEVPAYRSVCGATGRTGQKWAKRARNDMKHHKQSHAQGGLGKVHQLFGAELPKAIEELNRELAA